MGAARRPISTSLSDGIQGVYFVNLPSSPRDEPSTASAAGFESSFKSLEYLGRGRLLLFSAVLFIVKSFFHSEVASFTPGGGIISGSQSSSGLFLSLGDSFGNSS